MHTCKQKIPNAHRRCLVVAMMAAVLSLLAWPHARSVGSAHAPALAHAQQVSTATPSHRLLQSTFTASGIWVAREEVVIGSPVEGARVAQVLVESGDPVVSGQVLARLEHTILDSQARQAAQAAKRARVEFVHANEQFQRARRLLSAGAVSRQDYDSVRAAMLTAQAALRQAQAARDEQRARRAHADIRAPFAGIITQRDIQVGAMVGPQTPLFRLASNQPSEFLAQIPQQLLPELDVGMDAQIGTRGSNDSLKGSVRLISAVVDSATGYGQSRIALTAPPSRSIRPGTVGSARIALKPRDVLTLDVRAVRFGAEPYVFVVEAGRAKRTPVQIGQRQGGWVEIISGLNASSNVVTAGASLLQDGDPILAQRTASLALASKTRNRSSMPRPLKYLLWRRNALLASVAMDLDA